MKVRSLLKCLTAIVGVIALSGCFQKPNPIADFNKSASAKPDSCSGWCWSKATTEYSSHRFSLNSDVEMRQIISAAAKEVYWYVAVQGPGQLSLTYWGPDGKNVVYDVEYTKDGYTLTYGDSAFMGYDETSGKIHPIYDRWFETLVGRLNSKIMYTSLMNKMKGGNQQASAK